MADISLDDYIVKNQNTGSNTKSRLGPKISPVRANVTQNFNVTMQGKKPLNRHGPQFNVVGVGKPKGFDARQKLSRNEKQQRPMQDARQRLSQKNATGKNIQIHSAGVQGRIRIPRIQGPGQQQPSRIQAPGANFGTNVRMGPVRLKRPASAPGPVPNKMANLSTQDMRVKIQNSQTEKLDARQMIRARQKAKEAVEAASQSSRTSPAQRVTVTGLGNSFQDTGGDMGQGDGGHSVLSLGGTIRKTISAEPYEEEFSQPMAAVIQQGNSPIKKTIQNPSAIPAVTNRVGNNIVIAPSEQPYQYQPPAQPQPTQQHFAPSQYIQQDQYVQPSYDQAQYSQPQYVQHQHHHHQPQQQQQHQQHHQQPQQQQQQQQHQPHFREPMPMIRIKNDDYRSPVSALAPTPAPAPTPAHKPVLRHDYVESYHDQDERQPTARVAQPRSAAPKPVLQARLGELASEESVPDAISPLQGYRVMITNLHPIVTQDDIVELFGAVGALKKVRLIRPGTAEVVFIKREEALAAIKKYHNRELDGQPMQVILTTGGISSAPKPASVEEMPSQPLRLPRSSGGGGDANGAEVDVGLLHKALFKTTSKEDPPTRPVTFTVKI